MRFTSGTVATVCDLPKIKKRNHPLNGRYVVIEGSQSSQRFGVVLGPSDFDAGRLTVSLVRSNVINQIHESDFFTRLCESPDDYLEPGLRHFSPNQLKVIHRFTASSVVSADDSTPSSGNEAEATTSCDSSDESNLSIGNESVSSHVTTTDIHGEIIQCKYLLIQHFISYIKFTHKCIILLSIQILKRNLVRVMFELYRTDMNP